jgi:hypothetical protein
LGRGWDSRQSKALQYAQQLSPTIKKANTML